MIRKDDFEAIYNELILLWRSTQTVLELPKHSNPAEEILGKELEDIFDVVAYYAAANEGLSVEFIFEISNSHYLRSEENGKSFIYCAFKHFHPESRVSDGSSGLPTVMEPTILDISHDAITLLFIRACELHFNFNLPKEFIGGLENNIDENIAKQISVQMIDECFGVLTEYQMTSGS